MTKLGERRFGGWYEGTTFELCVDGRLLLERWLRLDTHDSMLILDTLSELSIILPTSLESICFRFDKEGIGGSTDVFLSLRSKYCW